MCLVYWARMFGFYDFLFSLARLDEKLSCKRLSRSLIVSSNGIVYMSLSKDLQKEIWRMDYLKSEMAILHILKSEFEIGVKNLDFEKRKCYKTTVNALFYKLLMRINEKQGVGIEAKHIKTIKKSQLSTKIGLISKSYLRVAKHSGYINKLMDKLSRIEDIYFITLSKPQN